MSDLTLRPGPASFEAVLEAAPDAMVLTDGKGRIVLINAQTERLFGYPRQDLLGKTVEVLVPERFRAGHPEHRQRFMADPKVRAMGIGLDLYARRRDGSEFPVEISLSPLETTSGMYVATAIRDVTQHKAAQDALQAANKELEAFAYSVSHDLRAPLRSMDGFSRILLEEYGPQLPAEARRHLETIVRSANEMSHLVDDLLAFSRIGRQAVQSQDVDIAALVQRVLSDLEGERAGRDVRIHVGELPPARGDPALLRQVFVNLLSNAVKYTRGRSPATIEVDWRDGAYHVRDNGVGFDMRYADKLFGVFQRLHRAEDYEGTGVGLAIAHRIVTRHGGRIWAEAAPDAGATFSFTLGRTP